MTWPSDEQKAIVDADLVPLSVVACAGSGKTKTAVHRLAEIRRRLGDSRGHVALLSFSNVAVETFKRDYLTLLQILPEVVGRSRVSIETVDSFITRNVLHPHAHRTMGSSTSSFLVVGPEPFLRNQNFQFWASPKNGDDFPVPAEVVGVSLVAGQPQFHCSPLAGGSLPIPNGQTVAERLGAVGAYTHDLGRYWAYRTLTEQVMVLRAIARRYPHVLVDEAQDVGSMHKAILELLAGAGVQVSLIGDPDQAIFAFAGADGAFLSDYHKRPGVQPYPLTTNYRSVPRIVGVANSVAKRTSTPDRPEPASINGAFFVPYSEAEKLKLVDSFQTAVSSGSLAVDSSAVVCRSRDLTNELRGTDSVHGQGVVKGFVVATLQRDVRSDYGEAFRVAAGCIVALLAKPPNGLLHSLSNPGRYPEIRPLHRMIWTFVRDSKAGMPHASLSADSAWHQALLQRVKALLECIRTNFGLEPADNLGNRLAKKKLPNMPLTNVDVLKGSSSRIRIDTVHQVKGESLDAVLYVATKAHAKALIDGVGSEDGRIGYVALTRARDLFWLGVPETCLAKLKDSLLALGFQQWIDPSA